MAEQPLNHRTLAERQADRPRPSNPLGGIGRPIPWPANDNRPRYRRMAARLALACVITATLTAGLFLWVM